MPKGLISLLIIILLPVSAISETQYSISGKVVDYESGQPISGASVTLKGTHTGTATDNDGEFQISGLSTDKITIVVTRIGYIKTEKVIDPKIDKTAYIEVSLKSESIKLDKINVTASRFAEESFESPVSVSVSLKQEFVERPFSTTAEVLREEPGILVQKTTYGHGSPILRGLIGKHVLLLYNGIRLNRSTFRFGANQYLNTVDLTTLDRIEVVHGSSSVMYGSDAMGGTINLIPIVPQVSNNKIEVKPGFSARFSSADNGFGSNVGFSGACRSISAYLNLSYKRIGDLRAGGDVGEQVPTGWEEANLAGRLFYLINEKNSLNLDYLAVRQTEVPRYDKYVSGDFEKYVYDPQNRDLLALTFNSLKPGRLITEIKANISFSREKEGWIEQKTGSADLKEYMDDLSTYGAFLQISAAPRKNHTLVFGWELYHDIVESRAHKISEGVIEIVRPTYPDNSKYFSFGIFLQDDWSLSDRMKLISGVRYSSFKLQSPLEQPYGAIDESYGDLTGSAALTYALNSQANFVARWSRGFRAPNLNDVAVVKTSSSGVDVPSLGLTPEKSNNFEIGIKVNATEYSGSIFLFYNRLGDLIDRKPGVYNGLTFLDENNNGIKDPDEFDVYERKNVDNARVFGFEYEGLLRLNSLWELAASCFWTRGENQTADEPLSRIPPLMGKFSIRLHAGRDVWHEVFIRAAGAQRRLSTRDLDDSRIDPGGTPGWATLNYRMQISMKFFRVTVSLENITDKTYKEHGSGIYSAGRNFMFSITYGG